MITTNELTSITARQHNGGREQSSSSKKQFKPPTWYVSPEKQIEKVEDFLEKNGYWGGPGNTYARPAIPPVPRFTPRTSSEVLMLTVVLPATDGRALILQRTFEAWWHELTQSGRRSKRIDTSPGQLMLTPGIDLLPGIRWVAFDPDAYHGKSPVWCIEHPIPGVSLASVEVLMAAALFPEWMRSRSSTFPLLSGLQCNLGSSGWDVPALDRGELRTHYALLGTQYATNPTVREC